MRDDHTRRKQTPWAYVLPGVMAIAGGMLLTDLVRLVVVAIGISGLTFKPGPPLGNSPDNSPASEHRPGASQQPASPPSLPGPVTARAQAISRACVAGSIAHREGNGWAQELRSGRPVPCRANSQ